MWSQPHTGALPRRNGCVGIRRRGLRQTGNWFLYGKILPSGKLALAWLALRNAPRTKHKGFTLLPGGGEYKGHACDSLYCSHCFWYLFTWFRWNIFFLFWAVHNFRKWNSFATGELRRSVAGLSSLWRWPVMDMFTHLDKVRLTKCCCAVSPFSFWDNYAALF